MEYIAKNIKDSLRFARKISQRIQPGDVIGFVGDLGTGKTTIIKEIAKNLGIMENVASPTFVIYKKYATDKKCDLVHVDAYRLSRNSEIITQEILTNKEKNMVIIEWADNIDLPSESVIIAIKYDDKNKNKRIINYETIH